MSSKKEKTEKQEEIKAEVQEETPETAAEQPEPEHKDEAKKEKKQKKESKREAELKETAEKLIQAEKDKYLRLCAEYDNFRKRSQKERDTLYADIKADTLIKFLPIYDNLERALATPTEDEAYRRGVEMIMTQFCTTMDKLGITEIDALGQKFDPNMHNAVMHIQDDAYGENEVVEVFQKGFKLNDKVIRFAMVKVAN
jgi:molecular chaperone GrpE